MPGHTVNMLGHAVQQVAGKQKSIAVISSERANDQLPLDWHAAGGDVLPEAHAMLLRHHNFVRNSDDKMNSKLNQ